MKGLYVNCFKNRLSDEAFFKSIKDILNNENIDITRIEKEKIGRNYQLDSYIIEINKRKYVFPLKLKLDAEDKFSNSVFFKASKIGKFIPRGIPNQLVELFYKSIAEKDDEAYLSLLKQVYSKEGIVSIFVDSVCYKENFKSHIKLIESSINSFFQDDFTSAIAVLLPCIEGISRKINATNSKMEDVYDRNANFRKETIVDQSIQRWRESFFPSNEYWFPPELEEDNKIFYYLDDVPNIIKAYYNFLDNFLYMKTEDFFNKYPNETLNRHEILHGYSLDYGTEENWYKLFNIFDFLLFVDNEFAFSRAQKSLESFEKYSRLQFTSEKRTKVDFEAIKFTDDFEKNILKNLIISVSDSLNNINIPRFVPKSYIKEWFKENLKDNIKFSYPLNNFSYYLKIDYSRNIIEIVYGSPNISIKEKKKNLLMINIDNEKITEDELANTYFIINIDSREKRVTDSKVVNHLNNL